MELINALPLSPPLLLGIVLVGLIILHYRRKYSFWSGKGVPGPLPIPFLGTDWVFLWKPLDEAYVNHSRTYGRLVGLYQNGSPLLNVSDASLIQSMCITDFNMITDHGSFPTYHPIFEKSLIGESGNKWKQTRTLLAPSFSSGKLRLMRPMMDECIGRMLEVLDQVAEHSAPLRVKKYFGCLSLQTIGKCGFGVDMKCFEEIGRGADPHENLYVRRMHEALRVSISGMILYGLLPTSIGKPLKLSGVSWDVMDFWVNLSSKLIKQRKASAADDERAKKPLDLLQHVVDSNKLAREDKEENNNATVVVGKLSDYEMAANTFLFLLAGYETTSTVMNHALFALARNPPIQERLHDEVDEFFAKSAGQSSENGYLDAIEEIMTKCTYLDAVLNETMRCYTPVFISERKVVSAEYAVPGTNLILTHGSRINICHVAVHEDPEYWPNPKTFDPERFMPENAASIVPGSFIPFHTGPRNCIGSRFALQALKMTMVSLIRRYKFGVIPGLTVDVPKNLKGSATATADLVVSISRR